MEPYEVLALVRRFTPLLLAHLVLGAIAGYAVAAFSPPVFTSTASAFVAASKDGTQSVTFIYGFQIRPTDDRSRCTLCKRSYLL